MENNKKFTKDPNQEYERAAAQAAAASTDAAISASGFAVPLPDVISNGIKETMRVPFKRIIWEENEWHCEPLIIKLFSTLQGKDGEQYPLDPDKTIIKLSDTQSWLEKGEVTQAEDGKSLKVEVKVRGEKMKEIFPPENRIRSINVITAPSIESWVLNKEQIISSPPKKYLGTTLTINVTLPEVFSSAAGLAAGAGMADLGHFVSKALSKQHEFPSQNVPYMVVPPVVKWSRNTNTDMFALDGAGEGYQINLTSNTELLPVNWLNDAQVKLSLDEDKEKRLSVYMHNPQEKESDCVLKDVTVDIVSRLGREVFKPVDAIYPESPSRSSTIIPLTIGTYSEYLGQQVEVINIEAQAIEVAVYFGGEPAKDYFLNDASRYLPVWRSRIVGGYHDLEVKLESQLAIKGNIEWFKAKSGSLLHRSLWYIDETTLDDKFNANRGLETKYIAPSAYRWRLNRSPDRRTVHCLIGPRSSSFDPDFDPDIFREDIDIFPIEGEENLYYTCLIENDILLKEPLPQVKLKVKIGPKDLVEGQEFVGLNEGFTESMVREFFVDLDLEQLVREVKRNSGDNDIGEE